MLVYVDTSVLVRAYLADESGHAEALALLSDDETLLVTSSLTRIEATSAVVRAGRVGRCDPALTLPVLEEDLSPEGPVTLLAPDRAATESEARAIVMAHGLRALDALHLACARLAAVPLLDPGATLHFASRDEAQAEAGRALGFVIV